MDVLLDTNVFLWIISDDPRLSDSARNVFLDEENRLLSSHPVFTEYGVTNLF